MTDTALPKPFLERLHRQFSDEEIKSILEGYSGQRPISLRVNTLKSTVPAIKQELENIGLEPQISSEYPTALILHSTTTRFLTDLEMYKQGFFYIQSLSSMTPVQILDPHEGEKVLDLAAAPGSKTTQIAAMMKNTGELVANEPNQERLFKLKHNLEQQGVENTRIVSFDGRSFWKNYPEYFNKVLIDAPCSMEGTFSLADKASFRYWSIKKIKQLANLQKWLLRSALSCAKVGGTVIYSTCTLSREENEKVIEWIIKKEKGAVELEKELRILPSLTMEGFFVAKLKKTRSMLPSYFKNPDFPLPE